METIELACPLCAMRIEGSEQALEKDRTCPRCKEWVKFVRSEEVPELIDAKQSAEPGTYSKAFVYGSVVALIGAALWACIGAFFYLEIGYLAWGIGACIGWVIAVVGMKGMANKGLIACGLTIGSLLIAKVIFLAISIPIEVHNLWAMDKEFREEVVHYHMIQKGEIKELKISEEVDAEHWDEEELDQYQENMEAIEGKMANLSEDEKEAAIDTYIDYLDQEMPFAAKAGMVFSLWDFLWFALALSSAFKIAESRDQLA